VSMTRSPSTGVQTQSRWQSSGEHPAPTAAGTTSSDDTPDPVLALLQHHQVSQISPPMIDAAEGRLQLALEQARRGRSGDAALLLRQLATDLGITLELG